MLTFLRSVLPASGNYVLSIQTINADGSDWLKNYHAATIEELEQEALRFDAFPNKTVFYALGNFKDNIHDDGKVGRTQAESHAFKTLAFDVDPKDKHNNVLYADQRTMVKTTLETCSKIGLPEPMFVSSGNGVHCYFPLNVEIPRGIWTRISVALRDALLATGMQLDTSKVCDASMVLRPIGTHNKKKSGVKQVKLLSKTVPTYDPLVLEDVLTKFLKTAGVVSKPSKGKKPGKKSAVADAILSSNFPPADSALIESKCMQINLIAQSGGNVQEPLWRLALGVAKSCIDVNLTAVRWSDKHPTFTHKKMQEKLDMWQGTAPGCDKFAAEDSAPCKNCQYKGKVANPAQLGVVIVSDTVVAPIPPSARGFAPPKGYKAKSDKLYFIDADDNAHFVSDYLLFPSGRFKDKHTGKSMAVVEAQLPLEGWVTFELPMDTLAKAGEFSLWLLNHQLFVHNDGVLLAMRKYMLTYMQELQQECESDQMSNSFGWVDDKCEEFVLGTRLITAGATGVVRLGPMAAEFGQAMMPKGDRDEWIKKTAMFNEPGMQLHGLAFLMSVGSPLMVGSGGLKSVLVNLYSKDSGTGKSTTGLFANSAYGSPDRLKMTTEDTENSLFKSMGVYGNLPIYIDEITEACKVPGKLGKIAYYVTQGRERTRMTKEGGFQERVEWESISTSSSNQDIYTSLGESTSYEGQSMRILQLTVGHTPLFPKVDHNTFGYEMALFLSRNYGIIGEEFVRGIIQNGGPHAIYAAAAKFFKSRYDFSFTGKERFWQGAMTIAYATGRLMKMLGLSLVDYDSCIRAGLMTIKALRKEFVEEKLDCFDTLGLYIGEHSHKTVIYKRNTNKNTGLVDQPHPHEAVARIEAVTTNNNPFVSGRLYINQVHFNNWCRDTGIDRKGVLHDLQMVGVTVHKDRRVSLMRGTTIPTPAVRVLEIEMTHPRFISVLQQNDLGVIPTDHLKLVGVA